METRAGFMRSKKPDRVTLLPDPPRARRYVPIISTDDHVVEPPDLFQGRVPARFAEAAPRIVDDESGGQAWLYDGRLNPQIGLAAVAGRPIEECSYEPVRFDEMRRAAWDPNARVHDMSLDGIYAAVNFPSALAGFCGHRLQLGISDPQLALATVRAYNDWHLESWCGTHPDRFIPCQIPWLLDPQVAAEEIRRNAARGFRAVSFSENPEPLGLPSIHSGHWDPFLAACEETGTVVCLHVGSSGASPTTSSDAPGDAIGALFFGFAMFAAVDWLYSKIPVRFPEIRICLSEGGIGWVAGLLDRLDHVGRYQEIYGTWQGIDLTPREVMQRNFWFCSLEDGAAFDVREAIGVENITVETDYPHLDTTWPDSQAILWRQIGDLPSDEIAAIAWRNAADLFGHVVPEAVIDDPECY
ncbi:MAG: amidohydrolase [Deltaproteobacteria bacterium]|nr:amidohydrolase [Deltaproteobacteria bacterium]